MATDIYGVPSSMGGSSAAYGSGSTYQPTAPKPAASTPGSTAPTAPTPVGAGNAVTLDSQYWADLAALNAHAQQDTAAVNLQGAQQTATYNWNVGQENIGYGMQTGQENTGYQTATGQAAAGYQDQLKLAAISEARAKRNMAEGFIGTGLLRSGYHDRSQRELLQDYNNQLGTWARQFGDANTNRTQAHQNALANMAFGHSSTLGGLGLQQSQQQATNSATLAAIAANLGIDTMGAQATAAGRYQNTQQTNFDNNLALWAQNPSNPLNQPTPEAPAAGADTAAPTAAPPTAAQIDKAKHIINNKADYDKAAIAWAQAILARR